MQGAQILQKYRSHHRTVGTSGVTCSKFHPENPQILGTTQKNLVAQAAWRPVYVHLLLSDD